MIPSGPILKPSDQREDTFGLLLETLPIQHPHVLCTGADIERVRGWVGQYSWVQLSLNRLLSNANQALEVPQVLPSPADAKLNSALLSHAERNALAYLLTDEPQYHERALSILRLLARGYDRLPVSGGGRFVGGGLSESRFAMELARTYDLFKAGGIEESDDVACRAMLQAYYAVLNGNGQRTCSNHNTWCLTGRVAIASALGDLQGISESLYGYPCPPVPESPDTGLWAYGLVHQLRHDILADGFHCERTLGYHFYTLMAFVESAMMLANIGIDLWHAQLPSQMESDGYDIHRDYGPEGMKCFKAAFDAPFYHAFANGDMSLLHDSGLANLRGIPIWGLLYEAAYDVYQDSKYAWLLHRFETKNATRELPGLPMSLQTRSGDLDFVRIRNAEYPAGDFSLANDITISLTGKHARGCSLFPSTGSAILRSDPTDENAPGLHIFWGPHSAGHQSPAALHVDVHAGGRFINAAPASKGYEDPKHLTWVRTTIAHNTVTVDERSMFPYDVDTDSIWESDSWRHRDSAGELVLFQIESDFKAVRATNQSVYPGVMLDRTLLLTRNFVLDVFRVLSDNEHLYDWAWHGVGAVTAIQSTAPVQLGEKRGYNHFSNARQIVTDSSSTMLIWEDGHSITRGQIFAPSGAQVILADDPVEQEPHTIGEGNVCHERTSLIVRSRAAQTVFISLWSFDTKEEVLIEAVRGSASRAIELDVRSDSDITTWRFPIQSERLLFNLPES